MEGGDMCVEEEEEEERVEGVRWTEGVLWVLLELKQHPVLLSGEQITMAQVQVVQSVDLSGHRLHHHNNSSLTKRCRIK